jgi:hypothetical protein
MFSRASHDRHRALSVFALMGLLVAGSLAAFGLPTVDVHGPLHWIGIMDPGCGGTRAIRLTILGRLGEAWNLNPAGIVAVAGAAAFLVRSAAGMATGRWLDVSIAWTPRRRRLISLAVVVPLVVLELRQQGRAELLLGRQ